MARVFERLYPEFGAGGYHRHNPRMAFFSRIRTLLPDDAEVLDFGAGRGRFALKEPRSMRRITDIAPLCRRFAAFDVDEAVLGNNETSDRHHAPPGAALPFADESFDLVYSWMVFEHVAAPAFYAAELARIVRPGGWICAGTPNRWGLVGIGARMLPNRLHGRALSVVSPRREERDIFPTTYRLNSRAAIRRHFPPAAFEDHSFFTFSGPVHHADRTWLARAWIAANWLTLPAMKSNLQVFLRKRGDQPSSENTTARSS